MWVRALAMTCAAAAVGCAGALKPMPAPMPTSSAGATGEMVFVASGLVTLPSGSVGSGATFSDHAVTGQNVNMAITPEGVWGGDLRGHNLHLELSEGRMGAVALELRVDREGDTLRLSGIFGGRRVNVELSPRRLHGTLDGATCSFDLNSEAPGQYRGLMSCPPSRGQRLPEVTTATFHLAGDAARLDQPVLPQMALGLLAVLPRVPPVAAVLPRASPVTHGR